MSIESRPLTVVHIAPTPFFADRGCHMRVRGLIHALNRRGVRNLLCTYHHGRDVDGIEIYRIPTISGYTKLEAGPSPYKYLADIYLLFKACQVIKRERPDVIHGHLHEGSLIGWMARWIFFWRRIPLVFDVQGSLVGELDAHGYFKKRQFIRPVFWAIEWFITRMPSHFFCSSQSSMKILEDEFTISPQRLSLVSDGTDVQTPDTKMVTSLRQRLELPSNISLVIYTGALLAAKGLKDLCDLVEAAARDELACHFLIVGYPLEELENFLLQNNLSKWCTLTGRVPYEELSNYLVLADVAIEPKLSASGEASGKLLNYMAVGLPVVCYDTPNNHDMLGSGGYLADQTTGISSLLTCLKQALNSPEEARQKGKIAQSRIKQNFSWDLAAEKIYKIYQQLIASA